MHGVAVIEHDQIVQPKVAGNAGSLLRDAFLNASVADESVRLVGKRFIIMCSDETLGNGTTHSHHMALSQWTAGVFNAMLYIQLGMAGCDAAPAAECFQVLGGITACQVQHAVQHWRHVAGVQEETVTRKPCGVIGVSNNVLGKQDVDKVGAAHGTSGMS